MTLLDPCIVTADTIDHVWFEALQAPLKLDEDGEPIFSQVYVNERGSYRGLCRAEIDTFILTLTEGWKEDMIPVMPGGMMEQAPTDRDKAEAYAEKLCNPIVTLAPNQEYTYEQRIWDPHVGFQPHDIKEMLMLSLVDDEKRIEDRIKEFMEGKGFAPPPELVDALDEMLEVAVIDPMMKNLALRHLRSDVDPETGKVYHSSLFLPQKIMPVEMVIEMYKKDGLNTNQAIMEVGMPSDVSLRDPPCLRLIDTRIRPDRKTGEPTLHFIVYFRSWDLYGGLPENLFGLESLKSYIATVLGVKNGWIRVLSKGAHIYEDRIPVACARINEPRAQERIEALMKRRHEEYAARRGR